MLVEYFSNNSGGRDWVSKEEWISLLNGGWIIRNFDKELSIEDLQNGARAKYASKEFNSIQEAKNEFEKLTNQNVSARGCPCCGPPHEFRELDYE